MLDRQRACSELHSAGSAEEVAVMDLVELTIVVFA